MSGFKEWLMQIDGQPSQESFLVNDDGDIILDYVGRTESLNEHFGEVCSHLGINASLPTKNESSHKKYTKYYNKKTIGRVKNYCSRDLEKLRYDFEGAKDKEAVKRLSKS